MAHDKWRRSGKWKRRIEQKRLDRLVRLPEAWLDALNRRGQLFVTGKEKK